jgi:Mn-dependent DtxR family transcriptional regulator
MTENTLKLLNYLKQQQKPVQLKATADALGLSWQGVNALFNQLVKNGFGERVPSAVTDEATGQEKEIKLLVLTDTGRSYTE